MAPAAPRFRSGGSDWDADEMETFRVLGEEPEDDIPLRAREIPPEDDDVAFDREVAARRVRTASSGPRAKPRPRPSRDDGRKDQCPAIASPITNERRAAGLSSIR